METDGSRTGLSLLIRQCAKERVSITELYSCFDKTMIEVGHDCPTQSHGWRNGRAQYLVWRHFFSTLSIPSTLQEFADVDDKVGKARDDYDPEAVGSSRMDKLFSDNADETTGKATTEDLNKTWVHDRYRSVDSTPNWSRRPQKCRDCPAQFESANELSRHLNCGECKARSCISNNTAMGDYYPATKVDSYRPPSTAMGDYYRPGTRYAQSKSASHTKSPDLFASTSKDICKVSDNGHNFKNVLDEPLAHLYRQSIIDKPSYPKLSAIAKVRGVSSKAFDVVIDRCTTVARRRHSEKHLNPEWISWKVQSFIWSELCPFYLGLFYLDIGTDELAVSPTQFPIAEPTWKADKGGSSGDLGSMTGSSSKPYSLVSVSKVIGRNPPFNYDIPTNLENSTIDTINLASVSQTRSLLSRPAINERELSSERSLSKVQSTMTPAPVFEQYHALGSVMERKVLELGGLDLRREFFQNIQEARDKMRMQHPNCTKDIRAYLADLEIWRQFFENEPFPRRMPLGGHSAQCNANRLKAIDQTVPALARPSQLMIPPTVVQPLYETSLQNQQSSSLANYTQASRTSALPNWPSQPIHQLTPLFTSPSSAAECGSNSQKKTLPHSETQFPAPDSVVKALNEAQAAIANNNSDEWIIVHNDRSTLCNGHSATEILRYFRNDDSRAIVEQKSDCHVRYFKEVTGTKLSPQRLLLWTEPFKKGDKASSTKGADFLQGWVQRTLMGGPVPFLVHWETVCKNSKVGQTENPWLSHLLILNSKYVRYPIQEIDRLQKAYFQDVEGNRQVGEILRCKLIWGKYIDGAMYLLAFPSPDYLRNLKSATQLWDNLVVERGRKFLEHWVEQVLNNDKAMGPSVLEHWQRYSAQEQESPQPLARLLVQGTVIPCSILGLKNISYSIPGGNENWLHITAIPFERYNKITLGNGREFLFNWAIKVLEEGEPIKMSLHWDVRYASKVSGFEVKSVKPHHNAKSSDLAITAHNNVELQWEQYAASFGANDLDQMSIEDKAKAEGVLRMVFDAETQQMVNLEEFKRRTQHRFLSTFTHILGPGPAGKAQASTASLEINSVGMGAVPCENCHPFADSNIRRQGELLWEQNAKREGKRKASDENEDQTKPEEKRLKVEVSQMMGD
ncbi:uncharacterized protein BP5553_02370 [Venustampulla echinocandica]|uniref:Uncharacterized protein n=1 Tax=Venustampulla echinocandica TaxID=2656787 RepID=A0A370U3N7_9HELO|nr:uncharacterized protein BP5553_02370 [Venustampulla echinocandica]RDL42391.1 hypothetical protein BP5553_02370 [Venustampulla echinocandica]